MNGTLSSTDYRRIDDTFSYKYIYDCVRIIEYNSKTSNIDNIYNYTENNSSTTSNI